MPELVLRPRTPEDLDFMRGLYASTRDDEMALVLAPPEVKQAFLDDQFRLQTLHYDTHYADARFLIIELEGQPIGRLFLHESPSNIYLMDIALVPAQRGRGIGTRLLKDILRKAHESGRGVTCHVEVPNPAQRLYRRLGFTPIGDHGVYVEMECKPGPPV